MQAAAPAQALTVEQVDDLLWRTGKNATFVPTTDAERRAISRLVEKMVAGSRVAEPPDPAAWGADAAAVGFRIERWDVGRQRYWALLEAPGARRGAGAYVVWVGPPQPLEVLLQTPHADYDTGTGAIGAQLFFSPPAGARSRALFTNTMHRYQSMPGRRVKAKDSPADVAHNPTHGFTAATEAVAVALGPVLVIQLHGFAGDDGEGAPVPPETTVVVSAGDAARSSPRSTAVAAALERAFGPGVRRFPEECHVLGGTTNAQGRALRRHPQAEFVHIEIGADLRRTLRADAARRGELWRALAGTGAR